MSVGNIRVIPQQSFQQTVPGIKKLSLAKCTGVPAGIRFLDLDARKNGFKDETIIEIYKTAFRQDDRQLTAALENQSKTQKRRQNAQFITVAEDPNTGKKSGYLSLTMLGKGTNHEVFLGITTEKESIAVSVPKKAPKTDCPPRELEYHEQLEGCSHVIQMKNYVADRCYLERARGNLAELLPQITNVPKVIKGVLHGGVQMAERGIIHLDLKLENILLGMDGKPKFADFEMASFVDEQGIATGNCFKGNLEYYSPERNTYVLNFLATNPHLLPSDHNVGLKDNVWGQMLLTCRLVKHSKTPWCQLSSKFQEKLAWYDALSIEAWNKGLAAGEKHKGPFMKAFCQHMQTELQKCVDGNLFGGLTPKTPIDDIVMRMAAIDPAERISVQEAARLFKLAERSTSVATYFEEVYPESKSAPASFGRSSGSTEEETVSNFSDPTGEIAHHISDLPSVPNQPVCVDLQQYLS